MNWNSFLPFNSFPAGMMSQAAVWGVWGPVFFLLLLGLLALKGFALWRAARNGHKVWFIAMLVINLIGILEVIYLLTAGKEEKPAAPQATETKNLSTP
ncbi:hypothetical protein EPN90_01255 [Patescibacteria group bacterium]|nr:MAG: hypothetical protein EPN90_01255 [Patescibacteria group bacterium]